MTASLWVSKNNNLIEKIKLFFNILVMKACYSVKALSKNEYLNDIFVGKYIEAVGQLEKDTSAIGILTSAQILLNAGEVSHT